MSEGNAGKGKRIAIIGVSALLLVAMVVAITVGVNLNENGSNNDTEDNKKNHVVSSIKAVQTLCHPTNYN